MMGGYGRGYNSGPMMGGGGWVYELLLLLFFLFVLAGVIVLIVWAVRTSSSRHAGPSGPGAPPHTFAHDEAVAIARKRLAAGEITHDEFDGIMHKLG